MFFMKPLITVLAVVSSALAITINGPSASNFWVQNQPNVISWSFNQGDPNPIDIFVTNSNSSFLNGPLSIARFVDLSNGTFTVTNVTLRVDPGFVVEFVNTTDPTQVFASSGTFDVRAPGTAPASQSASSSTATSPASSSSSSSSTSSASGSGTSGSQTASAALHSFEDDFVVFPLLMSAGMALVGAFIAL